MVDVIYQGGSPERLIWKERNANFVPEIGDEVCLPPDDDPTNEYTGGWHAYDVVNRRYFVEDNKVACYVER